jgi:hypothetical protein
MFSLGLTSNYSITYLPGTLTVNAAGLTITVTSTTNPSVYGQSVSFSVMVAASPAGGSTPSGTVQFQIDGTNFGTPVTLVAGQVSSTAINNLAAAEHTVQASYSGDSNYAAPAGSFTQVVTPATVIPHVTASNKTYDGTTTATLTGQSLSGVLAADAANVSLTVNAANFDSASAGVGKMVTATGLGLSGSAAADYTLGTAASVTTTADIDPIVPTRLVITGFPSGSIAVGASFPSLTVAAVDDAGHVATTFNGPVTVVLATDPTGATLDGTLTALASNGVATFSGLALDKEGSGYTLQFSGGGLAVTSDPSSTAGQVPSAAHQFFSTAQKQTFLELAMAYAQRAARLTALATVAPAPLEVPINELAAYYWYESQIYKAIADDPSDTDFTTVAPAQLVTVPPLSPGGGITQAEADTFNALLAEQAEALGLVQALSTAVDRAQAAAADPANAGSLESQLAAVTMFSQQLGPVAATEPGLLMNVQMALQDAGVPDVSVSASDVQALQDMAASALPAGLASALQQLAANDSQLQAIQFQDIQAAFRAQEPAAAAGSLAATLTDPVFAAQLQTATPVLTMAVVLSGELSPASDTGLSHVDGITDDATPTFVGTAPQGTTVELFAQSGVSSKPMRIGTTVVDASGNWKITATHLDDNTYAISTRFTAGDSGSVQVTPLTQVVIETVAPRITNVAYKSGKVTIAFNAPAGFNPGSLTDSQLYVARTKGAKSPPLKVSGIQQAVTQVTFTVAKGRLHPSTIYLEIISSGIQDVAGNMLDGAFNRSFPTGDGHPGSEFSHTLPIVTHKAAKPRKAPHKSNA